jgi:hypothetical protein
MQPEVKFGLCHICRDEADASAQASGFGAESRRIAEERRRLVAKKKSVSEKHGLPWDSRGGWSPYLSKLPEWRALIRQEKDLECASRVAYDAYKKLVDELDSKAIADCAVVWTDPEYGEDVLTCKKHLLELAEALP